MATIGELVAQRPERARVFEKYGIDYCCGGKVSLEEACRLRGLDAVQVEAELTTAPVVPNEPDWTTITSARTVIEHIMDRYHPALKEDLTRLDALMQRVGRVHGQTHPELLELQKCWNTVRDDLDGHLKKEEQILFPTIQEMESALAEGRPVAGAMCGLHGPVRQMEFEHEVVGRALATMRTVTNEYALPAGACGSYRALYSGLDKMEEELHRHIHLENSVLHPLAAALDQQLAQAG